MLKFRLVVGLQILMLGSLLVTACGATPAGLTPSVTVDPNQIRTQAVQTFAADLTLTALAAPSNNLRLQHHLCAVAEQQKHAGRHLTPAGDLHPCRHQHRGWGAGHRAAGGRRDRLLLWAFLRQRRDDPR